MSTSNYHSAQQNRPENGTKYPKPKEDKFCVTRHEKSFELGFQDQSYRSECDWSFFSGERTTIIDPGFENQEYYKLSLQDKSGKRTEISIELQDVKKIVSALRELLS